jgi:hypothetical protein
MCRVTPISSIHSAIQTPPPGEKPRERFDPALPSKRCSTTHRYRRNVIVLKSAWRMLLQNRTPLVCTLSENTIVTPEILIVREDNGYRLLHGQLHLTSALCQAPSVKVEVSGEGEALAYWDRRAILVEKDGQRLPLYRA